MRWLWTYCRSLHAGIDDLKDGERLVTHMRVFVVDALDECEEEGTIGVLLRLLPQIGDITNVRA